MGNSMLPPPPEHLTVQEMFIALAERRISSAPPPPLPSEESIEEAESEAEDVILQMARVRRTRDFALASKIVGLVVHGWSPEDADAEVTRGNRPASRAEIRAAENAVTMKPQRF